MTSRGFVKKTGSIDNNQQTCFGIGLNASELFTRVIDGFMIQGGGFGEDMQKKKTNAPIKNESKNGLKNEKYTLAMAGTGVPDSATSQCFINTADNSFLNREEARDGVGYAVFGKVVEGQEVVDKIGKVRTTLRSGMRDVPVEPIIIKAVELVVIGNVVVKPDILKEAAHLRSQ